MSLLLQIPLTGQKLWLGAILWGHTILWEADDEETLDTLVAGHDLTVSLLPYRFHVMVAKHCLKSKKNLVTTSYAKPEMMALDEEARQ